MAVAVSGCSSMRATWFAYLIGIAPLVLLSLYSIYLALLHSRAPSTLRCLSERSSASCPFINSFSDILLHRFNKCNDRSLIFNAFNHLQLQYSTLYLSSCLRLVLLHFICLIFCLLMLSPVLHSSSTNCCDHRHPRVSFCLSSSNLRPPPYTVFPMTYSSTKLKRIRTVRHSLSEPRVHTEEGWFYCSNWNTATATIHP